MRVAAVALSVLVAGCRGAHGSADDAGGDEAERAEAAASAAHATAPPLDSGPPDDSIPPTSSDELTARARHLLEAIAGDDPQLASDIEFPRDGWAATRDADDASKDWDKHVSVPFQKAIHKLSQRHKEVARAQFVAIELGHAVFQATPRRHHWKKPLWTVRGSRLTFVVDGRTRTLSVAEMTAWRGAWYVTRLR